jgi:rhomboid protease GluP
VRRGRGATSQSQARGGHADGPPSSQATASRSPEAEGPLLDPPPSLAAFGPLVFAVIAIVAASAAVKALDVVLSLRKGLAVAVAVFAFANGVLVHHLVERSLPRLAVALARDTDPLQIVRLMLANPEITAALAALAAALSTLAIHAHPLRRGVADIGFVGATLAAERARRTGV